MTKPDPWPSYVITGTPLDYVPIDAPIVAKSDIPDRPTRMAGFAINVGFLFVGLVVGLLF